MRVDPWGIQPAHSDGLGQTVDVPHETRTALYAAMGVEEGSEPPEPPVVVIREGESVPLAGPAEVILEHGERLSLTGAIPADLPLGYHLLHDGGRERRLIVGPRRCFLPEGLRTWGWAVQLYSMRSRRSWGIGDLHDLTRLARWTAGLGAGVLLVNPLGAVNPLSPLQASPYFPATRRYRDPLYVDVDAAPAAPEVEEERRLLAAEARRLNLAPRIDRDAVFRLKMRALEMSWDRFAGDPAFDAYIAAEGPGLAEFATYYALAEYHRAGWRDWPSEHRQPSSPAVARFAAENAGRVRFHQWVQWLLDAQLARAAGELRLVNDLPVGVDAGGADAWAWQDCFAEGVTVGAPPDDFNPEGQDWGLPPFVPHRLRQARYEPFVQTLRAALRHAGGLRIDHVMGLFRLYWVPRGKGPRRGAFVRYPARDLLTIVALESHRAGAFIVGEDLGTVEDGVREQLAEHRILSYRLMWFENGPPSEYPLLSLAAVTTHDLPTVAGLWSGAESRRQRERGLTPNEEVSREMIARLRSWTGLGEEATAEEAIRASHRALGAARSVIVAATLEDAIAVEERPNLPGTTTEWPNWCAALPRTLEEIETDARALALAREIGDARRGSAAANGIPAGEGAGL